MGSRVMACFIFTVPTFVGGLHKASKPLYQNLCLASQILSHRNHLISSCHKWNILWHYFPKLVQHFAYQQLRQVQRRSSRTLLSAPHTVTMDLFSDHHSQSVWADTSSEVSHFASMSLDRTCVLIVQAIDPLSSMPWSETTLCTKTSVKNRSSFVLRHIL